MKILLDECVPAQLRNAFSGHEVTTAQLQGWTGITNGELLAAAENAGFELFILAHKNLRYQQNLIGRNLAILELWTNHRPHFGKALSRNPDRSGIRLGTDCVLAETGSNRAFQARC